MSDLQYNELVDLMAFGEKLSYDELIAMAFKAKEQITESVEEVVPIHSVKIKDSEEFTKQWQIYLFIENNDNIER